MYSMLAQMYSCPVIEFLPIKWTVTHLLDLRKEVKTLLRPVRNVLPCETSEETSLLYLKYHICEEKPCNVNSNMYLIAFVFLKQRLMFKSLFLSLGRRFMKATWQHSRVVYQKPNESRWIIWYSGAFDRKEEIKIKSSWQVRKNDIFWEALQYAVTYKSSQIRISVVPAKKRY